MSNLPRITGVLKHFVPRRPLLIVLLMLTTPLVALVASGSTFVGDRIYPHIRAYLVGRPKLKVYLNGKEVQDVMSFNREGGWLTQRMDDGTVVRRDGKVTASEW